MGKIDLGLLCLELLCLCPLTVASEAHLPFEEEEEEEEKKKERPTRYHHPHYHRLITFKK